MASPIRSTMIVGSHRTSSQELRSLPRFICINSTLGLVLEKLGCFLPLSRQRLLQKGKETTVEVVIYFIDAIVARVW